MILWLGLRIPHKGSDEPVRVNGIFGREQDAYASCTQPNDIIGPVEYNKVLEDSEWKNAYYLLSLRAGE